MAGAWFWYTWYIHPLSTSVPSFNFLGLTVPEKSVTKIFNFWTLERKKNKGQIRSSSLIAVHTIHPPVVHVCIKFQLHKPHSSWEKCKKKIFMFELTSAHCPRMYQVSTLQASQFLRKKKGQISSSSLILVYAIQLSTVHVNIKFQSSRPYSSW